MRIHDAFDRISSMQVDVIQKHWLAARMLDLGFNVLFLDAGDEQNAAFLQVLCPQLCTDSLH